MGGKSVKFILANDLMYILSNRKKYLFLSIIVPFIICLLLSLNSSSDLSIMFYSLGNNLIIKNFNIIEIMMYIFNISMFVFFAVDLFSKDLLYQKDCIFFRINIVIWFLYKTVFVLSLCFCIKILKYLLITVYLKCILKFSTVYIIKVMFLDINYYILIYTILVGIYITWKLYSSSFSVVIMIILSIIFPKNIIHTESYYLVIVIISVFLYVNIVFLLKKAGKRMLEMEDSYENRSKKCLKKV